MIFNACNFCFSKFFSIANTCNLWKYFIFSIIYLQNLFHLKLANHGILYYLRSVDPSKIFFSIDCVNICFPESIVFANIYLFSIFFPMDFKRYAAADMKIYQYLCLHIKIIFQKFRIVTLFTIWDIHTRDIWNVGLQTYWKNRIC